MTKEDLGFYLIVATAIFGIAILAAFPNHVYADNEYFSNIENPDGSFTATVFSSPRIYDGANWQQYLYSEDSNHISIETNHGSVTLDKNSCSFSFYNNGRISDPVYDGNGNIISYNNDTPLFTDSIVPLMANQGTMAYTVVNSINNEACQPSWNGSELVAKKEKAGVGLLEYKYILIGGKWKTQLEATNLSGATNKQFGFTQTIDLNRDTINYGGSQKNLDNFDGQSFDRNWLENNEGKMIDLLNGFYFDFDLGFDNLYQVNVWDTGLNKSKLSFDYVYNQSVLLPGETLIIDPTFGYINAAQYSVRTNSATGAACPSSSYTVQATAANGYTYVPSSAASDVCLRQIPQFDITNLLIDNAVITDVSIRYDISSVSNARNCSYYPLANEPATSSGATMWTDSGDGTAFVTDDAGCTTNGNDKTLSLGANAVTNFQTAIDADQDWWGIGIKLHDETRDGSAHTERWNDGGTLKTELIVTYNLPPDPPRLFGAELSGPPYTVALTNQPGANNGDTHQTYQYQRWNGTDWVQLVSQAAANYTDSTPLQQTTSKYRAFDTGLLGYGCPQFAMNGTVISNLQSYFPLCYTVNDNGLLQNNGTVTGNQLYTNSTDIYFDFDGSSYITLPNESDYDFTKSDPFSIVFEFTGTNTGTQEALVAKNSGLGATAGWEVNFNSTNQLIFRIGDGASAYSAVPAATTYKDGSTYFMVFTYSGNSNQSGMKVYVDGVNVKTGSASAITGTITNNQAVLIGAYGAGSSILTGNLRNVMILDKELDSHEVDQLYNEYVDTHETISASVSTLTTGVVGDTVNANMTTTISGGFPNPTIDKKYLSVNGTETKTNSTSQTVSTFPQVITDTFWYRMTSPTDVYVLNGTADISNDVGTSNKTTATVNKSQAYDPSYLPAVDNPATQGSVNATVTRFDSEDGLLLKVNRIGVSTGDTWQIECIAQTNSQAAQNKNQSLTWEGTWRNTTNTGYFNTTYTGFLNSHAYITCFNEDELFTLTDFTDSSLALLGIALFDESYGSMIGVPVGIFFLVMTAGMANKRTAPTFIILITGIAGTMATIGFFSFEPIVWGLALVTAMLGIFVNQKIF